MEETSFISVKYFHHPTVVYYLLCFTVYSHKVRNGMYTLMIVIRPWQKSSEIDDETTRVSSNPLSENYCTQFGFMGNNNP